MANPNDVPETPQNPPTSVGGPQGPVSPLEKEQNKDARMWGMFAHLSAFTAVLTAGIGAIVGPLIIWQIKKEQYPFVEDQGKESLNFQITMLIYSLVASLTLFLCIGTILLPAVAIVDIVFTIVAAIKANDGIRYRYPKYLNLRLIK
jgi:uncharacterized Tic20 family protein